VSEDPFIAYFDQQVFDGGGNADGIWDAGETVDLEISLMNFGEAAEQVTATLTTSDPYVTIHQAGASYGDIATGGTVVNAAQPFIVEADPSTPLGHDAEFTLDLTHTGGAASTDFAVIVGKRHYLVWDPSPDTSSGPVIHTTLAGLGYSGTYVQEFPTSGLDHFQTMWVSLGIYAENHTIGANTAEALAIVDFLEDGGCVYLEGGDTWNYDVIVGGHDFGPSFGLSAPADGTGDCGPVNGMAGTFADGMAFSYAGENAWIDHLVPNDPKAALVLENGAPVYGLAVAYEAETYRTVGASFEFAGLVDGASPSTKSDLAAAIMDYFLPTQSGIEEDDAVLDARRLAAWPNPFNPKTTLRFTNPTVGHVTLRLFDCSGRLVTSLVDERLPAGSHETVWDGRDAGGRPVASGVYFARLEAEGFRTSGKLVLLK